jgi:hypothetical protein
VTDTKLVSEDLMACEAKGSEQAREQERTGRDLIKERRDLSQEYLTFLYY